MESKEVRQVKAFMSTGANREDARGMFPPHAVAYAEARAILGETEPEHRMIGMSSAPALAWAIYTKHNVPGRRAGLALAAALAAFVEGR